MNYTLIANIVGRILCLQALLLLPPSAISLFYGEMGALRALLITIVITGAAGFLLLLPRPRRTQYYAREGFVSVALAWIVLSVFGALPFFISREIPRFIDCLFETISGFTTTGASILPDPAVLPRGLLYWRSFTHWLGGMGVLVFVLAVDPELRGSGQAVHLLRAESPGPDVGKLVPKMHQSAKILYGIYIGLTLAHMLLLLAGGMPLFDTVTIAFGTAGTGGFAIRSDSLAGYSPYLQGITTLFMILFGINFNLYYLFLARHFSAALRSQELRLYVVLLVSSTVLITLNTAQNYTSGAQALHHAAFQVASVMTTTGFSTIDFNLWPNFSKCILLLLMAVGACGGSTGGGMKVSRLLLVVKSMRCEIGRLLSPRTVRVVRMDGKCVSPDTMRGLSLYLYAYFIITAASFLLVSIDHSDIETSISVVLACLNNIGPGLGLAGPAHSYAPFSALSKMVLCADMLLGRLEILPLLLLFVPSVWTRTNNAVSAREARRPAAGSLRDHFRRER